MAITRLQGKWDKQLKTGYRLLSSWQRGKNQNIIEVSGRKPKTTTRSCIWALASHTYIDLQTSVRPYQHHQPVRARQTIIQTNDFFACLEQTNRRWNRWKISWFETAEFIDTFDGHLDFNYGQKPWGAERGCPRWESVTVRLSKGNDFLVIVSWFGLWVDYGQNTLPG